MWSVPSGLRTSWRTTAPSGPSAARSTEWPATTSPGSGHATSCFRRDEPHPGVVEGLGRWLRRGCGGGGAGASAGGGVGVATGVSGTAGSAGAAAGPASASRAARRMAAWRRASRSTRRWRARRRARATAGSSASLGRSATGVSRTATFGRAGSPPEPPPAATPTRTNETANTASATAAMRRGGLTGTARVGSSPASASVDAPGRLAGPNREAGVLADQLALAHENLEPCAGGPHALEAMDAHERRGAQPRHRARRTAFPAAPGQHPRAARRAHGQDLHECPFREHDAGYPDHGKRPHQRRQLGFGFGVGAGMTVAPPSGAGRWAASTSANATTSPVVLRDAHRDLMDTRAIGPRDLGPRGVVHAVGVEIPLDGGDGALRRRRGRGERDRVAVDRIRRRPDERRRGPGGLVLGHRDLMADRRRRAVLVGRGQYDGVGARGAEGMPGCPHARPPAVAEVPVERDRVILRIRRRRRECGYRLTLQRLRRREAEVGGGRAVDRDRLRDCLFLLVVRLAGSHADGHRAGVGVGARHRASGAVVEVTVAVEVPADAVDGRGVRRELKGGRLTLVRGRRADREVVGDGVRVHRPEREGGRREQRHNRQAERHQAHSAALPAVNVHKS